MNRRAAGTLLIGSKYGGGGGNVVFLWYYVHIVCSTNDGIMLWRFSVACRLKLTDVF